MLNIFKGILCLIIAKIPEPHFIKMTLPNFEITSPTLYSPLNSISQTFEILISYSLFSNLKKAPW